MKLKLAFYSLVISSLLFSCTPNESSNNSNKIDNEIPESLKIEWSDSLKQEGNYLVFFYSDTCAHCQEIMGDVIAFANDNIKQLYFANTISNDTKITIKSNEEPVVGIDDISEFYIVGTPTLIEVAEGTVIANIPGKDACLTFLNNERLSAQK